MNDKNPPVENYKSGRLAVLASVKCGKWRRGTLEGKSRE
jgi:hypothetical protein